MSIDETKNSARKSLETLHDIAEEIEEALAESEDYWTWAGFYNDKRQELMPIKDRGKEAVDNLQEQVEKLREFDSDNNYENFFNEIDRKKERVGDVVDSLREMGSVKNAVMNGEELADLLRDLLERFRETSQSVDKLLEAMEES